MTGNERLAHLASVLARVPPERFDLGDWCVDTESDQGCGFSGCAVGWATRDLVLQAEGLSLLNGHPSTGNMEDAGWPAVRRFFDLNQNEAEYLFSGFSYLHADGSMVRQPKPSDVARRISNLITTGETE